MELTCCTSPMATILTTMMTINTFAIIISEGFGSKGLERRHRNDQVG
jgi:hypothetical protein